MSCCGRQTGPCIRQKGTARALSSPTASRRPSLWNLLPQPMPTSEWAADYQTSWQREPTTAADELLRPADRPVYQAKGHGKVAFVAHGVPTAELVEFAPAADADVRMGEES